MGQGRVIAHDDIDVLGFDINQNGRLDPGEPRATATSLGYYDPLKKASVVDLAELCPCRGLPLCEDAVDLQISLVDRSKQSVIWEGESFRVKVDSTCTALLFLGETRKLPELSKDQRSIALRLDNGLVTLDVPFRNLREDNLDDVGPQGPRAIEALAAIRDPKVPKVLRALRGQRDRLVRQVLED